MDLQAMRERAHKKEYVAKQQRWLLFLRHCAKCQAPEGQCTYGESCTTAKELWRHILTCADAHCQYPRSVLVAMLLPSRVHEEPEPEQVKEFDSAMPM